MKRPVLIYLAFLVLFGSGIWALLTYGPANTAEAATRTPPTAGAFTDSIATALHQPLILLLMQIVVIIGFTRVSGWPVGTTRQ